LQQAPHQSRVVRFSNYVIVLSGHISDRLPLPRKGFAVKLRSVAP
jgi:hypothetical protein